MAKRQARSPAGRPREFCEEKALDAAMGVFASRGYAGASLANLTQAMGINRVSMYAAFGNKEALFVKALNRYTEQGSVRLAHCLASGTAREAIERLLRDSVTMFTDPKGHGVCFVTQGPLSDTDASAKTRRFVASKRASIESTLRDRLDLAVTNGELTRTESTADLARFFAVMIQGLALQAQHGGTREELLRVVEQALSRWPAPGPTRAG
jgi:AcrR family transcriptional regulator